MSNMSELDARLHEAIERVAAGDITTRWEDETRTAHTDGSITFAYPITEGSHYENAPADAVYVAYTYRDGVLLHGPDFAATRSELMGGQS